MNLIGKSGTTDVVLFDIPSGKYVKAVGYKASVTDMLIASLSAMFGSQNVVLK